MNELTKEEVYHVAHLARINVTDDEVKKYQVQLRQILDEIERINKIKVKTDEILISPTDNKNVYREDIGIDEDVDIFKNAPRKSGNYIEIARFVNE